MVSLLPRFFPIPDFRQVCYCTQPESLIIVSSICYLVMFYASLATHLSPGELHQKDSIFPEQPSHYPVGEKGEKGVSRGGVFP
eukprot:759136-Hanusia_phi.AAC.6